jgi:hypothetical protein
MRKAILCLVILVFGAHCFGQQADTTRPLTREDYLQKSKQQKTAAWVLLGSGLALGVGGAAWAGSDWEASGPDVLLVLSGISMVSSIPLFIASGKNKRRAREASTSFKLEKYSHVHQGNLSVHYFPAVSIKLTL